MKVVIFAGGLGTRIGEETDTRPKPFIRLDLLNFEQNG
jgi:glucose-1-phosphate cytidylyltransferase